MELKRTLASLYVVSALCAGPLLAQGWEIETMPAGRSGMCVAVVGDAIHLIGGRTATDEVVATVERFHSLDFTWDTDLPQLLVARENAAATVRNDTIWVLGGRDTSGSILADVEFLPPGASGWQQFSPLANPREGLEAVTLRGVMYAIGGLGNDGDSERFLDSVEFYSPQSDKWLLLGNWRLAAGIASMASVEVSDSAFVLGGFSQIGPVNFVQRFEADSGALERSTLLESRGGLSAASRRDSILVIGGRDASDRVTDAVELFLSGINQWEYTYPLIVARENHVATTLAGTTYVFGGLNAGGATEASLEWITYGGLTTSIQTKPEPPTDIKLLGNYPNPFNAGSVIFFQLPAGSVTETQLLIHNVRGQLVAVLMDEFRNPGIQRVAWNGFDQYGKAVPSGIYIYTVTSGHQRSSGKMLLVR